MLNTDETVHRMLGNGSYFGEIALLCDQPRTMTVRSVTHALLFVIQRAALEELHPSDRDLLRLSAALRYRSRPRAAYRVSAPSATKDALHGSLDALGSLANAGGRSSSQATWSSTVSRSIFMMTKQPTAGGRSSAVWEPAGFDETLLPDDEDRAMAAPAPEGGPKPPSAACSAPATMELSSSSLTASMSADMLARLSGTALQRREDLTRIVPTAAEQAARKVDAEVVELLRTLANDEDHEASPLTECSSKKPAHRKSMAVPVHEGRRLMLEAALCKRGSVESSQQQPTDRSLGSVVSTVSVHIGRRPSAPPADRASSESLGPCHSCADLRDSCQSDASHPEDSESHERDSRMRESVDHTPLELAGHLQPTAPGGSWGDPLAA